MYPLSDKTNSFEEADTEDNCSLECLCIWYKCKDMRPTLSLHQPIMYLLGIYLPLSLLYYTDENKLVLVKAMWIHSLKSPVFTTSAMKSVLCFIAQASEQTLLLPVSAVLGLNTVFVYVTNCSCLFRADR